MFEDISYRIRNLRFAIGDISETLDNHKGWEKGYREGKLQAYKSELRFLEGLLETSEAA